MHSLFTSPSKLHPSFPDFTSPSYTSYLAGRNPQKPWTGLTRRSKGIHPPVWICAGVYTCVYIYICYCYCLGGVPYIYIYTYIYIYIQMEDNTIMYLFLFMPFAKKGCPLPVVRISTFTDFDCIHA